MKIIPVQDYVLVRMRDVPRESNVVLPEGSQAVPYGEVIAVGENCKFTKLGDLVLFHPNTLIGFDQGGDERFIISEGSIYGYIYPNDSQDATHNGV